MRSVSEPGESLVPPSERVATFDNDGTLWCEKPLYIQADFLFRRWKQMVDEHPAKRAEQPWKAVIEGDQAWLAGLQQRLPELVKGVTEAYDAITTKAFEQAVQETRPRRGSDPRMDRGEHEERLRDGVRSVE